MFTKFRDLSGEKQPYLLNFTQPNMSFTPREIIEQFASGEVIAQENTPSDDFYDDKYSDDDLASLRQIDDDFQARQAVLDYQIEQEQNQQNETSTSNQVRESVKEGADKPAEHVSTGNVQTGDVDTPKAGA